ncbi:MAG: hypothetical protein IAE94_01780 [Chthoniobacterales bacterium]|nr:hypothetical protein [Chthoniobacterales bacterium]
MPCTRHIIVCEGESEHAYLQRLQSFLDSQPLPPDTFEAPLRFIGPMHAVAKTGSFGKIKSAYNRTRTDNRKIPSIQVWADFDLYHRNDYHCADNYAAKTAGIPDFLFSFHNFEDFFALHFDGAPLAEWLKFGGPGGLRHFITPLHSEGYLPEIKRIFPGYGKGSLPADFVSWESLRNVKANLGHQPATNPHNLQGIRSFAEFLIHEIERFYPGSLNPVAVPPAPAPAPPAA